MEAEQASSSYSTVGCEGEVGAADVEVMAFEDAKKIILKWDSITEEAMGGLIFFEDREELDKYLQAVDEIQKLMGCSSLSDDLEEVNSFIQMAMARLEEEFRHLLLVHTYLTTDPLLTSSRSSSFSSTYLTADPLITSSRSSTFSSTYYSAVSSGYSTPARSAKDCFEDDYLLHQEDAPGDHDDGSAGPIPCTSYSPPCNFFKVHLSAEDVVEDLQSITRRVISAGYLRECIQVYSNVRKPALDESFQRLGIENLSIDDTQSPERGTLGSMVRRWIVAAKVCAIEKKLCELIFGGIGTAIGYACLMETIRGPAIHLFNFAKAISIRTRDPEELFNVLDLYDALMGFLPNIEEVFDSKSAEAILVHADEAVSGLGLAARRVLSEFEIAVLHAPTVLSMPWGAVHHLTTYVMTYINSVTSYQRTFNCLLKDHDREEPILLSSDMSPAAEEDNSSIGTCDASPMALHFHSVTSILERKLYDQAEIYRDTALQHIFLMNNIHYMGQKVKNSKLRPLFGDVWIRKLIGKFQQHARNYERATWSSILALLNDDGKSNSSSVSKISLKDRLLNFYLAFDEVYRTQTAWIISDAQLREDLIISTSTKVIQAYQTFVGQHANHISNSLYEFSADDLQNLLMDLFRGVSRSLQNPRLR